MFHAISCRVGGTALVLFAIVVIPPAGIHAQAPDTQTSVWLGFGVGGGGTQDFGGAAVSAQITYQHTPHAISVRGLAMLDVLGETGKGGGEIGVLYGRSAQSSIADASLSAGLALTGFTDVCGDTAGDCSVLGVPIVAEAALHVFPVLGLGIQAFTNLNTKAVYGGAIVFLQLGWLP